MGDTSYYTVGMHVPILFDRARLRRTRRRATHFLREEATHQAEEALASVHRQFPRVLTLGGALAARPGTLQHYCASFIAGDNPDIVADEEWLPFAPECFDACISLWGLHWVNDVPGVLRQLCHSLKPDGLFLAIIPGAETLRELRQALTVAEAEISGGISPRIAPFPDVREAGALLQRCGFVLPVASSETVTMTYSTLTALMHDLRAIGETNMLAAAQKTFTRRSIFTRASEHYATLRDAEQRLPASFEFITLMGWKAA